MEFNYEKFQETTLTLLEQHIKNRTHSNDKLQQRHPKVLQSLDYVKKNNDMHKRIFKKIIRDHIKSYKKSHTFFKVFISHKK